jgi:TolB-like protein/cytochrome c-type biogenesis protein CcmH/NrfG
MTLDNSVLAVNFYNQSLFCKTRLKMAALEELKNRGVFQTAALYIAIAWGGTEIFAFLIEALWGENTASAVSKYFAILFIAGFPVAMYLAWSRDLGLQARRFVSATALAVFLVAVLVWLVPSEQETPYLPPTTSDGIKALAVLPLENLSAEPAQDYFAAGMTEALIAELSQLGALRVISRTSILQYQGTTKTIPEIARELGVDAVVEGSVLRSGNQVRITVQLIEAATDHNLWADSFEGEIEDILALQSETARAIVLGVGSKLGAEDTPARKRKPVNPDAYDAYLKAKIMYLESTKEPEQAIQAVEQVIKLDPDFAPGYALLANLYGYLVLTNNPTHDDAYLRARKMARKAIELDPEHPEVRFALARVHYRFEWDWVAAEAEFQRGLALDPNNADGLNAYGAFRVLIHKDCDNGIALLEAARDRDPFNSGKHWDLGMFNFNCRRADESIKHMQQVIEMAPGNRWAKVVIVWDHLLNGSFSLAAEGCDSLIVEVGQNFDSGLLGGCAWVYSTAGQENKAKQILESLREPPVGISVDPVVLSWACFGLGDLECGFRQLEEGLRHRSSPMIFLRTAPAYDPVRDDPRFQEILDQMDFPP